MSEKMEKMYKPRIADRLLARKLAGKGAVLIEGPKWCGKTTTARQQAKSLLD
jgi:predicted AAA+ superfamily ATPase